MLRAPCFVTAYSKCASRSIGASPGASRCSTRRKFLERKTQINLWYLMIALLAVIWLRDLWVTSREVEPLAYSEFLHMLQSGQIADIAIRDNVISGSLTKPLANGETKFITTRVDPELADQLSHYNVKFRGIV